ncbi:MAG: GIY-YIG nuclease family protein [Patescibacteria group bacterium]
MNTNPATPWFVYILLCRNGSLYTGIAIDPHKRLLEHISGKGGAYTRSHPPVRIIYQETQPNRSVALKREAQIKRWSRRMKMKNLGLSIF